MEVFSLLEATQEYCRLDVFSLLEVTQEYFQFEVTLEYCQVGGDLAVTGNPGILPVRSVLAVSGDPGILPVRSVLAVRGDPCMNIAMLEVFSLLEVTQEY